MKNVSTRMLKLLAGYQFAIADLYTITLTANGDVIRWTGGDGDLSSTIPTIPTELSQLNDIHSYPSIITESPTHFYVGVNVDGGFYSVDKVTNVATRVEDDVLFAEVRGICYASGSVYLVGVNHGGTGTGGLFRCPVNGDTKTQIAWDAGTGVNPMAIATDGTHVFALCSSVYEDMVIKKYDLALALVATLTINAVHIEARLLWGAAIYVDNGTLWVIYSAGDGGFFRINSDGSAVDSFSSVCNYLAFTPTHVWASNSNNLLKINKTTGAVVATYSGFDAPRQLTYIDELKAFAVSCGTDSIVYVSEADGSIISTVTTYTTPQQTLYSDGQLIVTCSASNCLNILDQGVVAAPINQTPVTWKANGIERGDITSSIGVDVDECKVTLYPRDDQTINVLSYQAFARTGGLDDAIVKIELAIMPEYGDTSAGIIHVFEGKVTDVNPERDKVELTISTESIRLDTKIPIVVYQPSCAHTLYDEGCTLSRAAFTESFAVLSGSTTSVIKLTSAHSTGFYDLGRITFTSGDNVGLSRTVRTHTLATPSLLVLAQDFPFTPAIDDTFTVSAGCDNLRTTCAAKFSNEVRFLGWEYMPVPEASA